MAKKDKEKRISIRDLQNEYNELVMVKINESKGMYIGTHEATEAANAAATLYSKGIEAECRIRDSKVNFGKAVAGAIAMATDLCMTERNINTCLGLEQAYHCGKQEIQTIRKNYNPRKYLEK